MRVYGEAPYLVAIIHGGPGAAGEMAPVAQVLAQERGVIEPLQHGKSIDEQIAELKSAISEPTILIGYSWGAMISLLFAAQYPSLVSKVILISSGVFDEDYASQILQTRLERLDPSERAEVDELIAHAEEVDSIDRIAELFEHADAYDALPHEKPPISFDPEVYRSVWGEAQALRASGDLLRLLTGSIRCPVIAIHGDYDPHPAEGVRQPLSQVIPDFQFILLPRCGHKPWIERHARAPFFALLKKHLSAQM